MALSKDELAEALKNRVLRPCPICESGNWKVGSNIAAVLPLEDASGVVQVETNDYGVSFSGVRALPMVCQNCGYMALFQYDHIMDRLPRSP